jgi:hypothetical protein
MIDIYDKEGRLVYVSKDIQELEDYAAYLEEIFPEAVQERVRWEKGIGFNVLRVDIAEDATRKDLSDLLGLYGGKK